MNWKYRLKHALSRVNVDVYPFDFRNSIQNYLVHIIKLGGIELILDVGANVGQYAIMLRNMGYRGKIFSIEPMPSVWEELSERASSDQNWIVLPPVALTAKGGTQKERMFVTSNSVSSSLLPPTESKEFKITSEIDVNASTLDDVLESFEGNNYLVKMDVQGFESEVLKGFKTGRGLTRYLQLELSVVAQYENEATYEHVVDQLKSMGFDLIAIFPGIADEAGRIVQIEAVFENQTHRL